MAAVMAVVWHIKKNLNGNHLLISTGESRKSKCIFIKCQDMSPKSLSASEHIHTFNRTSPTHCVYAYFGILFERKYILQIFVLRYELYAYEESRYE